ncbi:ubiquinol-cytochrome C reductase complex core protein-like protein 2 [Delphinella strobiligena]|nr:ubiquinol-cytochrome C reductase complex core protein-like protein 2 [Delphinella strobiligena]
MLSRSSIGRTAQRTIRQQWQPANRRGLAAPASGSFQYESGEAKGVKFASRDLPGPTTNLAIVAKAGTRYESLPGLTLGLRGFAYKNTQKRSALRIQREAELLGSELYTNHSRENLIVGAKFLRDDLPYFVELLAEVATQTKYAPHVFHEEVEHVISLQQKKLLASPKDLAINSAHGLAFHRGLGVPVSPSSSVPISKYLDAEVIEEFAASAYSAPNFAVVANSVESGELSKWVGEFFTDIPSTSRVSIQSPQTKYYGGEERIAHAGGNAIVLAFSGSSLPNGDFYKPEISVLAALLGGQSTIKWSPGFSLLSKASAKYPGAQINTNSAIYSDAGLLTVTINGSAKDVGGAAAEAVKALEQIAQGVSKEEFTKAKALAKFKELEFGQNISAAIELTGSGLVQSSKPYQIDEVAKGYEAVTEESVKKAAKTLLETKASVSTVGDLYALPYAADIGLKV